MTSTDRQIAALTSEVGRLACLVEQLLRSESRPVSSSVDIDLCLRSDDPLEALQMRNKMLRKKNKKGGV